MKKLLLLLLTAFFFLCPVHAYSVYLELTSGSTVTFTISSYPVPLFVTEGEKLIFSYDNDETTYEYDMKDIVRIYVDKEQRTGIDNVVTAGGDYQFSGEGILLTGYAANEPVRVYSAAGYEYLSLYATERGELRIPCSDLAKGVNIIKTKFHSFKVIRK